MNGVAYALLDSGALEWPSITSAALSAVMGGVVLLVIKYMLSSHADAQSKKEVETAKRETAFNLRLDTLAFKLEVVDERARSKCETLGYEISDTRQELAHVCGERGLPLPKYPKRSV